MRDITTLIDQAVQKYGLPPEWREIGLRQLMDEDRGKPYSPALAMRGANQQPKNYGQPADDQVAKTEAWGRTIADLLKQTGGNHARALAAYKFGLVNPTAQGADKMPADARDYVTKMLGGLDLVTQDQTSQTYRPVRPVKPALGSLGPGDYHKAITSHSEPGTQPQDDALTSPRFDIGLYAPAGRAYGQELGL